MMTWLNIFKDPSFPSFRKLNCSSLTLSDAVHPTAVALAASLIFRAVPYILEKEAS